MAQLLAFESTTVGDVEETWRRFVPSAKLHRVDPRTFVFSWTSYAMPDFSVVRYDLAASVQSAIDPEDQIMACRVESRGGWVGTPRRDLSAGMPWLAVDGPTSARWGGSAQVRAFVFDRAAADRAARQAIGDERFSLRIDTTEPSPRSRDLAEQWERVFQHVDRSLQATAAHPDAALIDAELRRHALHATLLAFSPAFAAATERAVQRRAAPRTVRRAIAYIEGHVREPITIDDVAEAAGISTRGLQYAFRRALGVTPTQYLRTERLAGAHAELADGMPVSEVARRWGFGSPSRFAQHYRAAYGRRPSETARGA